MTEFNEPLQLQTLITDISPGILISAQNLFCRID